MTETKMGPRRHGKSTAKTGRTLDDIRRDAAEQERLAIEQHKSDYEDLVRIGADDGTYGADLDVVEICQAYERDLIAVHGSIAGTIFGRLPRDVNRLVADRARDVAQAAHALAVANQSRLEEAKAAEIAAAISEIQGKYDPAIEEAAEATSKAFAEVRAADRHRGAVAF